MPIKLDWKRERRWLASFGLALAAAGLVRYSTQGELTRLSEILLIGGGILFLAGLVLSYRDFITFFSARSNRLGANALTVSILVLVVLGLVNFLGYRHKKRVDVTSEKLYTLSDQSRKTVGELKKDVDIIRFARTPDTTFKDLATEYANAGSHIHYGEVDPQEKPEVARQYNVTHMNDIVVSSGSHNETLTGTGEQDVTNAIIKVTRDTVKTICFVEGHGEKSIASGEQDGLEGDDKALKNEGYQTKTVNLVSAGEVPSDCSVLVDVGPKQALFPQEAGFVSKYLDGGGRALLLLDPETDPKLDSVLDAWNIALGSNVVIDASGVGRLFGTGPAVPLVVDYGPSPIVQNFTGTMTFFNLARTVSLKDKSKSDPEGIELLKTSPRSFTVPNLKTNEVRYDPAKDQAGPLSLGVAAERHAAGAGDASKSARLVVIGNSAFATNQWAGLQRNGDLFVNTINWLAQDEDLISVRPKNPMNRRVILTETQQRELFFASMLFLPGLVIISGAVIWFRRR
jgi:gliding motility-associatede transport system auxiliary component